MSDMSWSYASPSWFFETALWSSDTFKDAEDYQWVNSIPTPFDSSWDLSGSHPNPMPLRGDMPPLVFPYTFGDWDGRGSLDMHERSFAAELEIETARNNGNETVGPQTWSAPRNDGPIHFYSTLR